MTKLLQVGSSSVASIYANASSPDCFSARNLDQELRLGALLARQQAVWPLNATSRSNQPLHRVSRWMRDSKRNVTHASAAAASVTGTSKNAVPNAGQVYQAGNPNVLSLGDRSKMGNCDQKAPGEASAARVSDSQKAQLQLRKTPRHFGLAK